MISGATGANLAGPPQRTKSLDKKAEAKGGLVFDALLERDMLQSQKAAQRSYAFSETGMFGVCRHAGNHPIIAMDDGHSADDVALTIEVQPASDGTAMDKIDKSRRSSGGVSHKGARNLDAILSAFRDQVSACKVQFGLLTDSAAMTQTAPASDPEGVADVGYVPTSRSSVATRPTPRIIVSGTDQALEIVIRSPSTDDADLLKLRNALDEAAAEFGMKIAALTINGSGTVGPNAMARRG